MARDIYAAFNVGEDDRHITTIDSAGVALAAIQGLYQVVQEKDVKIVAQQKRIDSLSASCGVGASGTNARAAHPNDVNVALAMIVGAAGLVAIDRARKGGTK